VWVFPRLAAWLRLGLVCLGCWVWALPVLLCPRLVLWVWLVVWPCVFCVRVRCLVMVGVLWCCGGGVRLLGLTLVWLMGCWGLRLCLGVLVVVLPRLCVRLCLWWLPRLVLCPRLVPRPCLVLFPCPRLWWGVLVRGLVLVCVIGVRGLALVVVWCLVVAWCLAGGLGLWGVCVVSCLGLV